jgi:transposase
MQFNISSIFVGIDVHKYTHTAAALDCFGQTKSTCVFSNTTINQFLTWLSSLSDQPTNLANLVVGVEDLNGYGYHISRALVEKGYQTYYVPPILTGRQRLRSTHKAKTDLLDAIRVAKVMLTSSEQTLPAEPIVHQSEIIRTLSLILPEKESLVKHQTELKNQLHANLHQYYGDDYKKNFKGCFSIQAIDWYQQDLKEKDSPLSAGIKRRLTQLTLIQDQLKDIEKQVKKVCLNHPGIQTLIKSLPGCGLDSACKIVSEIGTIKRFATKEKLARYAGLAPVDRSSGNNLRHHTDHGGNRKLNRAIHQIALSQLGKFGPDIAKTYHKKKQKEGKSKLWSMRCLKRHLSDKVYTLLADAS